MGSCCKIMMQTYMQDNDKHMQDNDNKLSCKVMIKHDKFMCKRMITNTPHDNDNKYHATCCFYHYLASVHNYLACLSLSFFIIMFHHYLVLKSYAYKTTLCVIRRFRGEGRHRSRALERTLARVFT